MVTVTRNFYHKICGRTTFYNREVKTFDTIVQARDYCYQLCRHGYTAYEIPAPYSAIPVIVYSNDICQIDCFLEVSN